MPSGDFSRIRNWIFPERTVPLHALPVNCGHQKTGDHGYVWNGLQRGNREMAIWQYTLAGRGALRIKDQLFPVLPGEGFLVFIPEDHCYFLPPDSPEWEFIFVSFQGSELLRLAGEFRRRYGILHRLSPEGAAVRKARALGRLPVNASCCRASAAAYDFVMTLFDGPPCDHAAGARKELLHRIHDYVLAHLDSSPSLAELAEVAGLSQWHFARRFRAAAGRPVHGFVLELKMRFAMRLLQTSGESIKEIAAACGFNDASYFCKVFLRMYRTTPGEFRRGVSPMPIDIVKKM